MTRLATAFAKGHPALVTFVTGVDGPTAAVLANLCGRGDNNIFSVAENLGVEL